MNHYIKLKAKGRRGRNATINIYDGSLISPANKIVLVCVCLSTITNGLLNVKLGGAFFASNGQANEQTQAIT